MTILDFIIELVRRMLIGAVVIFFIIFAALSWMFKQITAFLSSFGLTWGEVIVVIGAVGALIVAIQAASILYEMFFEPKGKYRPTSAYRAVGPEASLDVCENPLNQPSDEVGNRSADEEAARRAQLRSHFEL